LGELKSKKFWNPVRPFCLSLPYLLCLFADILFLPQTLPKEESVEKANATIEEQKSEIIRLAGIAEALNVSGYDSFLWLAVEDIPISSLSLSYRSN
jgi:hypothetical protein